MQLTSLPLPANLDIDAHLRRFPLPEDLIPDRLVYLLSLLISIPASNKEIRKRPEGWVPLNSKLLEKRIRPCKRYLEYALGETFPDDQDAKLIQTDGQYFNGSKSRYFRFILKYRASIEIRNREITNKALLRNFQDEKYKRIQQVTGLYPSLVRWFNPEYLKIDTENAIKYSWLLKNKGQEQYSNKFFALINSTSDSSSSQVTNQIDYNLQHQSSIYNINRIANGDFYLSVDSNVRRFHSNLSNLKSELRYFLTYNGQSLVSIDIKNSQPFLSIALLNPEFFADPTLSIPNDEIDFGQQEPHSSQSKSNSMEDPELVSRTFEDTIDLEGSTVDSATTDQRDSTIFSLRNIALEIQETLKNTTVRLPLLRKKKEGNRTITTLPSNHLASLFMFSIYLKNTTHQDISQYISEVVSGTFYEYLQEKFKNHLQVEYVSRKEVKEAIFLILFTSNLYFNNKEAAPKRIFAEIFPTVYKYFALIKKKDKSTLPRLLQSIESWLILDVICRRIASEQPELPIFTIHDSIITTTGNEDYVKKVMEEEIEKYIQHKPTLEVTHYKPNSLMDEIRDMEQQVLIKELFG